ncbi:MAG: hypothetical protein AAGA85_12345 [Bacteroidota bacterium]
MNRLLKLLLISTLLNVPIACDTGNGCQFGDVRSEVQSVTFEAGNLASDQFVPLETVAQPASALKIEVQEVQYVEIASMPYAFFTTSLWACAPPSPKEASLISKIKISADTELTVGALRYEAGEDLSDLFQVVNDEAGSISDFIRQQNATPLLFSETTNSLIIQFKEAPTPFTADLSVVIEFEEGRSIFAALASVTFE